MTTQVLHITTNRIERPTGPHFAGIRILFEDGRPTKMHHWSSLAMCPFCGCFECFEEHSPKGIMTMMDLIGIQDRKEPIILEWQELYKVEAAGGTRWWPLTDEAAKFVLNWFMRRALSSRGE